VVALGSTGDDGWGPRVTFLPCCPIRVLLSVMYLLVENIRVELETDPPEWKSCRETFRTELSEPWGVTVSFSGDTPGTALSSLLLPPC